MKRNKKKTLNFHAEPPDADNKQKLFGELQKFSNINLTQNLGLLCVVCEAQKGEFIFLV